MRLVVLLVFVLTWMKEEYISLSMDSLLEDHCNSSGASANGLTGRWRPVVSVNNTTANKHEINFGQRPFKFAPPAGYKMLCSSNLPRASKVAVKPENHFKTFLQDMGGKYYRKKICIINLHPLIYAIQSLFMINQTLLLDL